jgi:hypothetical protein
MAQKKSSSPYSQLEEGGERGKRMMGVCNAITVKGVEEG